MTRKYRTAQLQKMLTDGTMKPNALASHMPSDGFRTLGTYKEFQGAALGTLTKKAARQEQRPRPRRVEKDRGRRGSAGRKRASQRRRGYRGSSQHSLLGRCFLPQNRACQSRRQSLDCIILFSLPPRCGNPIRLRFRAPRPLLPPSSPPPPPLRRRVRRRVPRQLTQRKLGGDVIRRRLFR